MKLIKFITKEEFDKLLKAEKKREYKLAYSLGFGSGLRISEIIGLRKALSKCCQAELETKIIKVDKKNRKERYCTKCHTEVKTQNEVRRSKTEWDIVPLSKENVDLESRQIRLIGAKGNKDRITCTSPLLNKTNIQLLPLNINRRTLQHRITTLGKRILKKDISMHSCRHGFGNYMVNEKNVPLPIVQTLMGHARLDTTGIYTKANPVQAIEKVWEAFK